MEAQEQGTQYREPDIAEDAIPAACGLCRALQLLRHEKDAGAFVAIERPAVLARVHDEARTSPISLHGDFSKSMLGGEAGSRSHSRKRLRFFGESVREDVAKRSSSEGFP